MGKKRIHELAKELSLTNAEVLQRLIGLNFPGANKLTSSHSIEDSVAEQIRLAVKGAGHAGPQVVVRRRKKQPVATQPEAPAPQAPKAPEAKAGKAQVTLESEPQAQPQAQAQPQVQEAPEPPKPPVRIKQKPYERATIIGTSSGRSQDGQRGQRGQRAGSGNKSSVPIPDFLKLRPQAPVEEELVPDLPTPPEASPQLEDATMEGSQALTDQEPLESQAAKVPSPAETIQGETQRQQVKTGIGQRGTPAKIVGSRPAKAPTPGFPPLPGRGADISLAPPLGTGAEAPLPRRGKVTRDLSEERKGAEAAVVVGVKPQWRGRAEPQKPREDAKPGAKGVPSRDQRPGERDTRGDQRQDDRGADSRKRDKRKKGGGFQQEGEADSGRGGKRRSIVEHTDLYSEGTWEKTRHRGKQKTQKKTQAKTEITVPKAIKRRIKVDEVISVAELAHRLSLKAGDIIKKLMGMGVVATVNQSLDFDTASLVANEFGYEVEKSAFDEGEFLPQGDLSERYELFPRPPVVTIMGHVDHGKTSLLDYIRKSKVQEGEAGGITQHIGAYHVSVGERFITFLDTPGHEAFTSMRSRGAQVTDIVILIVAADDGVMPQTREAADHAKAAKVPIIVAVNKIDKPGADPERVRREMMELGLTQEAWGGDTVFCDISAKTGQGVPELLDMILLQADLLNLQARREGPARGAVIEARLDKGRGAVATVLVEEGTLKQGDSYVCGIHYGKLRALLDDSGRRVEDAGPASPVEIQGISGVPLAGDEFVVMEDEKQAKQVSQHRHAKRRETILVKSTRLTLENLFDHIKAGSLKGLNLVVKADVQGSLEAILDAVSRLHNTEIKISVLHSGTGAVTETDVMLASASNALIICFGLKTAIGRVQDIAEAEAVQIRYYNVIYKLIDDLKEAMAGLLDPVKSEKILGFAEVRTVFNISKVGPIAGCAVSEGRILRGARARLHRGKDIVYDGKVATLKRVKNDVREVLEGYECGIGLENFGDIMEGDRIECYQVEEIAPTVDLINQAVERASERAREEQKGEGA
ncbi:MAG: translation initiation factor IF-2 [Deltaproteobacteria bacterium]|jgi:translation initiation factor IF-2|nr:translation initiation factor IF-2 [Deltaproteobacteria bacterium]